jgi:hypothetical protein
MIVPDLEICLQLSHGSDGKFEWKSYTVKLFFCNGARIWWVSMAVNPNVSMVMLHVRANDLKLYMMMIFTTMHKANK